MLKIRRVSQQERQLKVWQQQYHVDVNAHGINSELRYFNVNLQGKNQHINVLVPVEYWCRHHWPDLAHYAWGTLSAQVLCDIFAFENQSNGFFDGQYTYRSVEIIGGHELQAFYLFLTENHLGDVYFSTPFDGLPIREQTSRVNKNITLSADWVLGCSYISLSLLHTLALGDALYIQQLQLNMSIAGRVFARFQKQEEGLFMIEEILSPEEGVEVHPIEDFQNEIEQPFNLADMSIKLTFVLGHSDIPITELNHIQAGAIFSIGENKEREVKVYANKQLVAEGELIYLGDDNELGLEITRVISLGDTRV